MSLSNSLNNAEKNARKRELERENQTSFTSEDMQSANELAEKAAKQRMRLIPEKRVQERSYFAQFIQENWAYLNTTKYLTSAEKVFLLDLLPLIGFRTNCIVENPKAHAQMPLTQDEIAEQIGRYAPDVSRILKSLEKKYVVFKGTTGSEDNNSKSNAIYLNPNIMYSGDRDRPEPHLFTMFPKPPKELKKLPVDLIPQIKKTRKSKGTQTTKTTRKTKSTKKVQKSES